MSDFISIKGCRVTYYDMVIKNEEGMLSVVHKPRVEAIAKNGDVWLRQNKHELKKYLKGVLAHFEYDEFDAQGMCLALTKRGYFDPSKDGWKLVKEAGK